MAMKIRFCEKHPGGAIGSVCQHIKSSVEENKALKSLVLLAYETYVPHVVHRKYLICDACAEKHAVPMSGALVFDPNARYDIEHPDSNVEITEREDPFKDLTKELASVCTECLKDVYGDRIDVALASNNSAIETPMPATARTRNK